MLRAKAPLRLKFGPVSVKGSMRPRKVILCVDDNEQTLAVRKFLLETRGYRVITAVSGVTALECIEQTDPAGIDLLLSDLVMPQMDGNELVRRARVLRPALPTLMVSGSVAAQERGSAADAFLPKGACSPAELLERVRVLMIRKRGPKKAVVSAAAMDTDVYATSLPLASPTPLEQRLAS